MTSVFSVGDERAGGLLREWRRRRRKSQFDLACEAEISARYLRSLETGRSRLDREMLLHLGECLEVPLRVRNIMLAAAGFEPVFQQRDFHGPALAVARRDVEMILAAHDPSPAMAVDRQWTMLSANKAVAYLVAGAEPALLRPPVNLLRLCLHPAGLACRIVNLREWRSHIMARLRRQIEVSGYTGLVDLLEEIRGYPLPPAAGSPERKPPTASPPSACRFGAGSLCAAPEVEPSQVVVDDIHGIATPLQLVTIDGTLSFFSTTTLFGTPADITLSEMTIEAFLPADQQTAEILRRNALCPPTWEPVDRRRQGICTEALPV